MTTVQEKIAIMQAFADGKAIEYSMDGDHWDVTSRPSWAWDAYQYRIREVVKPSINWDHVRPDFKWLMVDGDETPCLSVNKPSYDEEGDYWFVEGSDVVATSHVSYVPGNCHARDSLVKRPVEAVSVDWKAIDAACSNGHPVAVAMDGDGDVYAYINDVPIKDKAIEKWRVNCGWYFRADGHVKYPEGTDWKDSLITRPNSV